jgi:hypothetical protein
MTLYGTLKPALVQAVTAVDAKMRVYDYVVNPLDTAADRVFQLFGELDPGGSVPEKDVDRVINFASVTRKNPGRFDEVHATGRGADSHTPNEARFGQSVWQIDLWRSVQDPVVDPKITTPSEYGFQAKLDTLVRELFLNSAVVSLMTSKYKVVILSVDLGDMGYVPLQERFWCHQTSVLVTAQHIQTRDTY